MSRKDAPNPLAGLVSRKGQATPTRPLDEVAVPSPPPAAAPAVVEPAAPVPPALSAATTAATPAAPSKALTVKLDGERYRRLRLLAVETDMSHQDILVAAFDAYVQQQRPKQ